MSRYVARPHKVMHDGREIGKTIGERVKELKDRGVEGKKRKER